MRLILTALALTVTYSVAEVVSVDPWEYVCEQVGELKNNPTVCEAVVPPQMIFTDVINIGWVRLEGVYVKGEPYIFIARNAANPMRTIEHEMTHYLMYEAYKLMDNCEHERIARFVAGQPWTEVEQSRYGCGRSTDKDRTTPEED